MRFEEEAAQTIVTAQQRLLAILESAGYRGTIRGTLPPLTPGSSVHYGGTVRMHSSARYGMLNAWNRLHAVDNVVVADAGSFTTGVEKNPVPTAMALAARAADRLAEDLRTS
jgi:choline dehydrogenase-like flavoprotein